MKAFVVLACVCAVAHAQFGQFGQTQTRQQSAFGNQQSSFASQQRQSNFNQQSSFASQPRQQSSFGNQQSSFASQPRQQSSFGNQQSSFASQPQVKSSPGNCRESNERYPVSGSCDRYIECINGTSEEKLCPDGLRFNPNVNFNVYPCQYPNDVPCLERSSLQPAQPTADCPNQFGYFRLGDARNCSYFRNCVNGVGYDFTCPDGLAWNPDSYRCDWPDEVAECDAEAFLGFRCPEVPISKELGAPAGYRFYRSDTNCQRYFMCIEGRPRALACGGDSAFDELTSTCVSADEVASCPQELRQAAANARAQAKDLLEKEIQVNRLTPQQKRRY